MVHNCDLYPWSIGRDDAESPKMEQSPWEKDDIFHGDYFMILMTLCLDVPILRQTQWAVSYRVGKPCKLTMIQMYLCYTMRFGGMCPMCQHGLAIWNFRESGGRLSKVMDVMWNHKLSKLLIMLLMEKHLWWNGVPSSFRNAPIRGFPNNGDAPKSSSELPVNIILIIWFHLPSGND